MIDKKFKGRFGDTEIRNVDGRPAHVNLMEAFLIDRKDKLGEEIVKDIGAGTINPATGLREYNPGHGALGFHYHPPSTNINTGGYADIFDKDVNDPPITTQDVLPVTTGITTGGGTGGTGTTGTTGTTGITGDNTGFTLDTDLNIDTGIISDEDVNVGANQDAWTFTWKGKEYTIDEGGALDFGGDYDQLKEALGLGSFQHWDLLSFADRGKWEDLGLTPDLFPTDPEYVPNVHLGDPNIGPEWEDTIMSHISTNQTYDPLLDINKDGAINVLDITAAPQSSKVGEFADEDFTFTYRDDIRDADHFDPTSDEYRQYVQETGEYDELITRFLDTEDSEYAKYFQAFDPTELEYIGAQQDLDMNKFNLKQESLVKQLESARTDYGLGMRTAGLRTGQSLFDIKGQISGQTGKAGFASSGASASLGRKATRGIFQDYKTQQLALGEGLGMAKTAFDLGSQEVQYGKEGARLKFGKAIADFWKEDEEKFYNRLMEVETLKKS